MSARGAPAPPTSGLYLSHVRHQRSGALRHAFTYRLVMVWLDLADPRALADRRPFLGRERAGAMSLRAADHGPRDGSALLPWARARLAAAGLPESAGARIFLLTMPRVFGYVFNPLSVFYCYDERDQLAALIYEVRNTFGDWHCYVLPAGPEAGGAARQETAKGFHVSPFLPLTGGYRFRAAPPGRRLALAIAFDSGDAHQLVATLTGTWRPASRARLAATLVTHPLATYKATAAIYWQAVRLAAKRAPFHRRPPNGVPVTGGAPARPGTSEPERGEER